MFKGGDDQLLSGVAKIVRGASGFRLIGAHELAPEILVGEGRSGSSSRPSAHDAGHRARV